MKEKLKKKKERLFLPIVQLHHLMTLCKYEEKKRIKVYLHIFTPKMRLIHQLIRINLKCINDTLPTSEKQENK